jgi:Putative MetA-pathway of phenol degradation
MAADAGIVWHRAGLLLILALPVTVHAAHPLISEDSATQGRGKFELEIGNAWTRDGSDRSFELGPQLSYGILPQLDAILRPTWLDQRSTIDGEGDTAADLKWRFFQRDKLSLAVRAGVNAPTGDADRGLGSGKPTYHGLLVASIDLAPIALHANIGYTRNRADPTERRDLYHVSAAAVWTLNETWRLLLAELAGDTNVDNTRSVWPACGARGRNLHDQKRLRHRHRLPDTSQPRGGEPDSADRAHGALGALMIDAAPGRVL